MVTVARLAEIFVGRSRLQTGGGGLAITRTAGRIENAWLRLSVCTAVGVHCSVGVHCYGRVMASQDTNPLKTILFAAADGIGHAAQTTRHRLVASIPGQNPSRGRGQAAWDARVASPRADTEAFARGGRIAAQLADYLDNDPQRHAPVVTTTGGRVDPSGCSESY